MSNQKGERQTVVAVKLRYNPKVFWFDPALSSYNTGDHVLVDTERGREIGLVVDGALEVTAKQVSSLKTPLKPVIRALDANDYQRIDELDAKGHEAMPIFRELIEKHQLEMKPVSVDYLFTGDKAVFYFSNDERVDFRDLVRDLAARFHVRVDMRQIGVRDEARILGGLAHCGEELCCARLGGEFQPVSIRMAKEQDLPLNPAKISGACGRLMCCLRYEFEAYKDFKNRAPKRGAIIETPIGQAKVIDYDTPREIITMRLEDGKQLSIPLKEFECCEDGNGNKHPCRVNRDSIDRCASSSILMALAALEQELVPAKPAAGRGRQDGRDTDDQRTARRPRRGKGRSQDGEPENGAKPVDGVRGRRPDRARSADKPVGSGRQGRKPEDGRAAAASPDAVGGDGARRDTGRRDAAQPRRRSSQKSRPRPGQHSSGLRGPGRPDGAAAGSGSGSGSGSAHSDENRTPSTSSTSPRPDDGRRRRRRQGGR
jgi:cell fate regulator YaaT (PSP1 superfamily)